MNKALSTDNEIIMRFGTGHYRITPHPQSRRTAIIRRLGSINIFICICLLLYFLGAGLGSGAVSHLLRARLLMRMPIQVVGQAIGAAALPALTRLWAEGKKAELNDVVLTMLRSALGIGVLAAGGLLVFGASITTLLFERDSQ